MVRWFGDAGDAGEGMNNFEKIIFTGVAFSKQPITINGLTFTIFDQTEEIMKNKKIISNVCMYSELGAERHPEDGSSVVTEYVRACVSNSHGDVFLHNHVWGRRWRGEGRAHDETERLCERIKGSFLGKKSVNDLDARYWSRARSRYGSDAYVERGEEDEQARHEIVEESKRW